MPARRRACVPGTSRTNGGASSRAAPPHVTARWPTSSIPVDGAGTASSPAAAGPSRRAGPGGRQGLRGHAVPSPNRMFSVSGRYETIGRPTSEDGCTAWLARRAWWASTPVITSSGRGVV